MPAEQGRAPEDPAAPGPDDCVVLLTGGHRIHLQGVTPSTVEKEVVAAKERTGEGDGFHALIYLHANNHPTNSIVVAPEHVAAVVGKQASPQF